MVFGTYLLKNIKNNSSRNVRYNYSINDLLNSLDKFDFDILWKMFTKKFSNSKKGSPSVRGLDLDSEKLKNGIIQ